jgi:hypothetical protein
VPLIEAPLIPTYKLLGTKLLRLRMCNRQEKRCLTEATVVQSRKARKMGQTMKTPPLGSIVRTTISVRPSYLPRHEVTKVHFVHWESTMPALVFTWAGEQPEFVVFSLH